MIPTNWLRLLTGFAHSRTSCAKSSSSFQTRDNNNNKKTSAAAPLLTRSPERRQGDSLFVRLAALLYHLGQRQPRARHQWRHTSVTGGVTADHGAPLTSVLERNRRSRRHSSDCLVSEMMWNTRARGIGASASSKLAHVGMATNCYASFSPNSLQSHSFSSSSVPHALSQAFSSFLPAQSEHAPAGQAVLDPAVWRHSRLTNGRDRGRSQTRCADSDSTHLCGGRPGRKRVSAAGGRGRADPFCWYSMDKLF